MSKQFSTHLKSQGTVCCLTVHDTPKENGVSKHLNHILLEHACTMLIMSDLPKFVWMESIRHSVWLKNWTSTHALNGKAPYKHLHGKPPSLAGLLEWGT